MKKEDIKNRSDIEHLVKSFYSRVNKNALIGFFFTEVVAVNWEKHIPVMVDFWENVLFFTGSYGGNPMEAHRMVNQKHKMDSVHFDEWVKIFTATVDELYEGEQADNIKQRATNIATIMKFKIIPDQSGILQN
jgi:hemoglobin